MEVRTVYVAFPGTSYETSFKTEEEFEPVKQMLPQEFGCIVYR